MAFFGGELAGDATVGPGEDIGAGPQARQCQTRTVPSLPLVNRFLPSAVTVAPTPALVAAELGRHRGVGEVPQPDGAVLAGAGNVRSVWADGQVVGDELFELVHAQYGIGTLAAGCEHHDRSIVLFPFGGQASDQTGTQQGRLPTTRRPHHLEKPVLPQPDHQVGDQFFPTEEPTGILFLKWNRTDVRRLLTLTE